LNRKQDVDERFIVRWFIISLAAKVLQDQKNDLHWSTITTNLPEGTTHLYLD
jgi:hypothetical protein